MKPRGVPHRIKANRSRQVPTNSYCPPEYYEDSYHKCADCKAEFLFSAEEQQAWYEEFKIPHYATQVRCEICRKKHRRGQQLKTEYDAASAELNAAKQDAEANFLFGRLGCEFHEHFAKGDLQKPIAALRRALRLNAKLIEAHYWLARCYELAGRKKPAAESFAKYLDAAESKKNGELKKRLSDARKRYEALTGENS